MRLSHEFQSRLLSGLTQLYAERAPQCLARIAALADRYPTHVAGDRSSLWNEQDVILITYADQISGLGNTPLATLRRFLLQHQLNGLFSTLHILPFFPSSSDDGFAVTDYRVVDPTVGSWHDIQVLDQSFDLMFDLVLNHCSARHPWFQHYLAGLHPYRGYFMEADPLGDYGTVTRPRSTPVLTPFQAAGGERHLWTTFSADQVDLNWANPDVLVEMLDTLLFYVQHGARIIRLDAVAYVWKMKGTSCIHLPQAHVVVKLMRMLLEAVAPDRLLVTETNVPHTENVSYFGTGDEAHVVYQFSLPPLLLDAFLSGDARALMGWLAQLERTFPGTTYLNFTASHDGIGLRPLEGLISAERLDRLVAAVRTTGGLISTRRKADGTDSAYELNSSYFSAMGALPHPTSQTHVRRFLASQAIMLALQGIPAVYFHSLVGTPNDVQGVQRTGRARAINRHKFDWHELQALLTPLESVQSQVFEGYCRMLAVRMGQLAFHPDADQEVLEVNNRSVIAFVRTSADGCQQILVMANVADTTVSIHVPPSFEHSRASELICMGASWQAGNHLSLAPGGFAWLTRTP